jgi:hypothetical protein
MQKVTSASESSPTLEQLLERSRRLRHECDRLHAELQALETLIADRAETKPPKKKSLA